MFSAANIHDDSLDSHVIRVSMSVVASAVGYEDEMGRINLIQNRILLGIDHVRLCRIATDEERPTQNSCGSRLFEVLNIQKYTGP